MSSKSFANIGSKCLRYSSLQPKFRESELLVRRFQSRLSSKTQNPSVYTSKSLLVNKKWPLKPSKRLMTTNGARSNVDRHTEVLVNDMTCIQCYEESVQLTMQQHMIIINDFITEAEEQSIVDEVEPYLKRMRYESSHWDDAIHSYRETERKQWRETNKPVIQRIRDTAFPKHVSQLAFVHILDLSKEGYIKPHVDAVRFCGNTIAGLSLLSPAVMRLVHTEDSSKKADILLNRRSLYIMKEDARYDFTHEVLRSEESFFKGGPISRDRRIAVICRNEPE